jgi:hypothetical protein
MLHNMHVASVCFKCVICILHAFAMAFKCFRVFCKCFNCFERMLQVFHLDVVKVDLVLHMLQ